MSDEYLAGQAVRLSTGQIQTGVTTLSPIDPSTIALTITQPDSSTITKAITDFTHDGTGLFHYDFLPSQTGYHTWRIVTTLPNTAAEGSFVIKATGLGSPVIDLQDFKNYLNLTSNSSLGGDAELQAFLDASVDLIGFRIGAITPTPLVERFHGGTGDITTASNIISVTSVIEWIGATPYTLTQQDYVNSGPFGTYGYSIDGPKTLTRRTLGYPSAFAYGRYNVIVTYQGGFVSTPPAILAAIKELGKHLFKTQSGGRSNVPVDWNKSLAFSMPNRVLELIAEYDQGAAMFA